MSVDRPTDAWIPMEARDLSPAEVGGAISVPVEHTRVYEGGSATAELIPIRFVIGALWSLTRVRDHRQEVLSLTAEISVPHERALEVVELRPDARVWILADVDLAIEQALAEGSGS